MDRRGRILVVRRRTEPGKGLWTLPGGRCETGEAPRDACVRETREESGLDVVVDRFAGRVVRPGPREFTEYVITDYICSIIGGALRAGDDAIDVVWVEKETFCELPLTVGLLDTLASWGIVSSMDARRRSFRLEERRAN